MPPSTSQELSDLKGLVTPITRKQLERIVWEWQKRLGLGTWDVKLDFSEPCPDNADAVVTRSNQYERATVRFDKDWPKWTKPFANLIVAHEMVHLLTRDIDEVWKEAEKQDVLDRIFDREMEKLVDKLAYRFVEIGGLV